MLLTMLTLYFILDEYATFKRVYESPILASRSPDCTSKARELGIARAEQVRS